MSERFGYDGASRWRIVATVAGVRKVLAWADPPEPDDLIPFRRAQGYADVRFEPVPDKAAEAFAYPSHGGRPS